MTWTMREAAEVVLAGRRAARRTGGEFTVDRQRMAYAGFIPAEIDDIECAADRIEQFKEAELSSLQRRL